jgi:hypothetical protein
MIAYATLEKPVGQPDSRAKAHRESAGLDHTKLRRLRGDWLRGPSREVVVDCAACGVKAGEPSPKTAIGCNRLQFSLAEWVERPRLSSYNRHVRQKAADSRLSREPLQPFQERTARRGIHCGDFAL